MTLYMYLLQKSTNECKEVEENFIGWTFRRPRQIFHMIRVVTKGTRSLPETWIINRIKKFIHRSYAYLLGSSRMKRADVLHAGSGFVVTFRRCKLRGSVSNSSGMGPRTGSNNLWLFSTSPDQPPLKWYANSRIPHRLRTWWWVRWAVLTNEIFHTSSPSDFHLAWERTVCW